MPELRNDAFLQSDGLMCKSNQYVLWSVQHTHEFYECVLLLEGCANHCIERETERLSCGQFVFVPPGTPHCLLQAAEVPPLILTLALSADEWRRLENFAGCGLNDVLSSARQQIFTLSALDFENVLRGFDLIQTSGSMGRSMRIRALAIQLISVAVDSRTVLADSGRTRNTALERALVQLRQSEYLREGVAALIRLSGYSRGHLCRIMRENYGMSPHAYVEQLRMNKAENLLRFTDQSIADISDELGYASQSYFTARFHACTGKTPNQLRRK